MTLKHPKIAVFMIDGFDIEYYRKTEMPTMQHMAKEGFFKRGSAIFPSLTNANNISIACGCWPDAHGVTTNCYYDRDTDQAYFLENSEVLNAPTIFEIAAKKGLRSALLTCKAKTAQILGKGADITITAESPDDDIVQKYGQAPPMYSSEINYWLFDIALDLVDNSDDLDLIYVHTTDYPMHMWPPEAPESQEYLKTLDSYLQRFHTAAPDFTIALTADHGMNKKTRCWDLEKACFNRKVPIQFSVSPVADRLLKHHGGHGGVSYVYLKETADMDRVRRTILALDGVEQVLSREEAAEKFSLMASRIGDLVIIPDRDTVFGDLEHECVTLPPEYRSHGSLYEMDIPLLLFNTKGKEPEYRDINYNLDLTRFLMDVGKDTI